jgi:K(+)-stimulated pyrophosphate-energized sodium pump
MAGVTVSGVLWAIFQNNAGGAWDNAKKSFEAGVEINGVMTYKGSEAHKAAVTGDTVGDPFKDTSGPSMNILIKLTCLIGLVIAPILGGHSASDSHSAMQNETIMVDQAMKTSIENKDIVETEIETEVKKQIETLEGVDVEVIEAKVIEEIENN